jgi:hypothetical protein
MIKNAKDLLKGLRKKPKLIIALLFLFLGTILSTAIIYNESAKKKVTRERFLLLEAIKLNYELINARNIFILLDIEKSDHAEIIRIRNKFVEISNQTKTFPKTKFPGQFMSRICKVSDFYISFCDHRIDLLNKFQLMNADWALNNHFDTQKFELLLCKSSNFATQVKKMDDELVISLISQIDDWEKKISKVDYEIFEREWQILLSNFNEKNIKKPSSHRVSLWKKLKRIFE